MSVIQNFRLKIIGQRFSSPVHTAGNWIIKSYVILKFTTVVPNLQISIITGMVRKINAQIDREVMALELGTSTFELTPKLLLCTSTILSDIG
jgi:hypothetical protein